jgi:putative Mn2+ efflux pump MntP
MNEARYSKLVMSLLASTAVGLVVGLNLSSYRLQELLVCWLCFSIGFVSLALAILGIVLACYAGKYLIHCATAALRVIARAAQSPAKPT